MNGENMIVDYNDKEDLFGFHIPGVDKVTHAASDEIKKILNQVLPHVILPVMSEILKPLEKLMFTAGVAVLQTSFNEVNKAIAKFEPVQNPVPSHLVEKAITFYGGIHGYWGNDWAKWLSAIGHPRFQQWDKLSMDEALAQEQIWSGWTPFVNALRSGQRYSGRNPDQLIEDFNKINFYIANTGNVAVGLYFSNVYDRADHIINTLKKYEHTGVPAKRSAIMEFIYEVQPNQADITASVKLELGLQIGGSIGAWSVPADLFDVLLEDVLKQAGVPA